MRSVTRRGSRSSKIGGDDLGVVKGSVGEGAATVAIAHRPNAIDIGAQLFVDRDVATFVSR